MSLSDAIKKLKYDNRLTDIYLKYGELDKKELEAHLESLEDVADNSESISFYDLDDSRDSEQSTH